MLPVELQDLRLVTRGDFVHGTGTGEATGATTDSRAVRKGDVFFAIRGQNTDGHAYVAEALQKGAAAVVIDREIAMPRRGNVLRVRDTVAALGDLARLVRAKFTSPVIAITGSNGKTTAKDMLAHVLSADRSVVSSQKSYNNHLGLPITLLSLTKETDVAVVECGTSAPGEIAALAAICRPDVSVVTTVSETHLGGFGSIEAIAREKAALVEKLGPAGTAILNADNEHTKRMARATTARVMTFGFFRGADVKGSAIEGGPDGIRFLVNDRVPFVLPICGRWMAYNALAATAAASTLGVDAAQVAERLMSFRLPPMRMEKIERAGITFVNDAYNANPRAVTLALDEIELWEARRRVFIFGDMLELGSDSARLHERVGDRVARSPGIGMFVSIGPEATRAAHKARALRHGLEVHAFASTEEAARALPDLLREGDLALIKGSRGMRLERLLAAFEPVELAVVA
ncbi:MAG: UDP-N-acetylmuramoyl-tripeptide--D-alanyl-D-alanine ligase [Candidatus Brocadiae bacterium]|nr:UDP-N-acetylmuramoyl-tripeptide--D-alanyl-D-alanine ligase [Candidatus Brocadiia bacterium]